MAIIRVNGADKTDSDVAAVLGLDPSRLAAYRVIVPGAHPPSRHLAIWTCSIVVLVLLAASGASTLKIDHLRASSGGRLGSNPESLGAYAFTLAPTAPLAAARTQAVVTLPPPAQPSRSMRKKGVRVARAGAFMPAHMKQDVGDAWSTSARGPGARSAADRAEARQIAMRPSLASLGPAIVAQAVPLENRRLERAERLEAIDAISLLRQK